MAPAAGPKLLKSVATGRSAKRSWLRRRGKAAKAGGSPGARGKTAKVPAAPYVYFPPVWSYVFYILLATNEPPDFKITI